MTKMTRDRTGGQVPVAGGVDTHADTHTAAVVDVNGGLLGLCQFPATGPGYAELLAWLRSYGQLLIVGVEGTGAYGAGLARHLRGQQVALVEVDRPNRAARRRAGKSDPLDAVAAARAALGQVATGIPKDGTGPVEALRNLRVARRSAVIQRADCVRQIKSLLITAAEPLRASLRGLKTVPLLAACVRLRPDTKRAGEPQQATQIALLALARRHQGLSQEISDLNRLINPLVKAINPALLAIKGVGPDTAGQLLVTAGDNPHRLRSETAFAMLCGVAPLPASSGKTHRHRLNRGGDRQANAALLRVVVSRLRWDTRTQAYLARRTDADPASAKSNAEAIRCLKRYVAREIYPVLMASVTPAARPA
jgi:transposase